MADLNFKISQNVILGSYTISRLPQNLTAFGSRFVVIMDSVLKEVGLQDKILHPLLERKIEYFVVDNIADGASTKEIEHTLNLARQGRVQGVVAVGGTKTLLAGTMIASLYNAERTIYDYIDGTALESEGIPLICVPTTIRAPYAFTSYAPVIDSRNRQIKLFKPQKDLCRLVLWDSNFPTTLTGKQISSSSIETICLATEAYLSQKASFFSDMFVEKAVELLGFGTASEKSLEIATPKEDLLEEGGCLSSIASAISSVGVASLLSLTMNARYEISRSITASILFPYIIEDAGKFKADRIEKIAKLMKIAPQDMERAASVSAFAENIRQSLIKANLPVRLRDLGLSIDQLALTAEDAGQLDIMNCLPRSTTTDELFELMKNAF